MDQLQGLSAGRRNQADLADFGVPGFKERQRQRMGDSLGPRIAIWVGTTLVVSAATVAWRRHDRLTAFADWELHADAASGSALGVAPAALAAIRMVFGTVCLVVLVLLTAKPGGAGHWMFFTVWSYSLASLYFLTSGLASLGCLRALPSKRRRTVGRAVLVLYEVTFTSALFLDAVLWSVLYTYADAETKADLRSPTSIWYGATR